VGGAWFFIVFSLLRVSWAIVVMWADPASTTSLYHTVVGDVSYDAWAMTYTGIAGLSLISGGQQRIEHYNLNNRSHNLNTYFNWDYYVEPMRRNILWEPIDAAE